MLVTAAEAGVALAGPVAPSTSSFTGVEQACSYTTDAGGTLLVTSRLISRAGFETSIQQRTAEKLPLTGVCQDAYLSGSIVLAWKNGTEVDARLFATTPNFVAAAKKLAVTACTRL